MTDGYEEVVRRAADLLRDSLNPDGTWPSFLVTGWLGAAVMTKVGNFYEAARMQGVLQDRLPTMSGGDTAALAAAMRRSGMSDDDWTLVAARRRLSETQRSDGGWSSDDGPLFDVEVTLNAIRGCR
jgi:hypothetical protein